MIDNFIVLWEWLWAYIAPIGLVLAMGGMAIYAIFIVPREEDSLWCQSESVGYGLTIAALTYGFVVWFFESKGMDDGIEFDETYPMSDTILSMLVTLLGLWTAKLFRWAGLPWIVIGILCILGVLFGF